MEMEDLKSQVTDEIIAEHLDYFKHTLYVIFHGAIAFYDDPGVNWIEAFLTDVKDDHQYLCGKFLGEVRIPAGSEITLLGAEGGHDKFANYSDDFFHWAGGTVTPAATLRLDGVYSRFRFPRPRRILHCRNFINPDHPELRKFCTVPVFQYHFEHIKKLCLRVFLNRAMSCPDDMARPDTFIGWCPTPRDPVPLTLHIRAEEDYGRAAVGRDSQLTRKILGVVTKPENDPAKWTDRDPNPDTLPGMSFGRKHWEVDLTLANRVDWLQSNVGTVIQNNPPGANQPFTVYAPDVFHDNNASCGKESGGPFNGGDGG